MSWNDQEAGQVELAMAEMLSGYSLQVGKLTFVAYCRQMQEFPAKTAIQALRLVPLFVRGRNPYVGDAFTIAEQIRRAGHRAVAYAARQWVAYEGDDRSQALTPRRLYDAVTRALKHVPNENLAASAALLPEDAATPTESSRQFEALVQEGRTMGLGEEEARMRAIKRILGTFGRGFGNSDTASAGAAQGDPAQDNAEKAAHTA